MEGTKRQDKRKKQRVSLTVKAIYGEHDDLIRVVEERQLASGQSRQQVLFELLYAGANKPYTPQPQLQARLDQTIQYTQWLEEQGRLVSDQVQAAFTQIEAFQRENDELRQKLTVLPQAIDAMVKKQLSSYKPDTDESVEEQIEYLNESLQTIVGWTEQMNPYFEQMNALKKQVEVLQKQMAQEQETGSKKRSKLKLPTLQDDEDLMTDEEAEALKKRMAQATW